MRDQRAAQHRIRVFMDLVEAASKLDATGLAASAGVHLRLHDPEVAAEFLRRLDGRIRGVGRDAARYRNAVLGKQSFRLVFVEIHQDLRQVCRENDGVFWRFVRLMSTIRG